MERRRIRAEELSIRIHRAWNTEWFLLTSGQLGAGRFNTMTVAWGGMGTMWNKPFVMVVVRPQRYTFEFMEKSQDFTLCGFGISHRDALNLLGSRSGRDGDKVAESGLTPRPSVAVGSPSFQEAGLVVECRTMYRDRIDPQGFLDPGIQKHYPDRDYHAVYFGEVVHVECTEDYLSPHAGPSGA